MPIDQRSQLLETTESQRKKKNKKTKKEKKKKGKNARKYLQCSSKVVGALKQKCCINLTVFMLKCYSQILYGGSAENLNLGYFVLIWWQTDKKQDILKWIELQGSVYLDRTAICMINYQI